MKSTLPLLIISLLEYALFLGFLAMTTKAFFYFFLKEKMGRKEKMLRRDNSPVIAKIQ